MSISWTPGPPPDAMKDGREVLVWAYGQAIVAWWYHGEWMCEVCSLLPVDQITHWSEANPPEGAE